MKFFSKYRNNKLMRRLRSSIVDALAKDYGSSDYYTTKQVIATLRRNKYASKYDLLAIAMFCNQEAFTAYFGDSKGSESYTSLRTEIGDLFFNGRLKYKQAEIMGGRGNNRRKVGDNGAYGHGDTAGGGD